MFLLLLSQLPLFSPHVLLTRCRHAPTCLVPPPLPSRSVEGVPLLFAALSERAAADWVGIYSHVDLVVINPGPESAAAPPPSPVGGTPPPALPCAAGVTFALTSVLGRARYTTTRASLLSHFFVGAAVALATMLVARPFRWWLAARAAAGADGEGALDGQRLPLRGGADEPPPMEQAAAVA